MKKVLTVLLAIAVVFTFSFGSTVAFAADNNSYTIDDWSTALNAEKDAQLNYLKTAKDQAMRLYDDLYNDEGFVTEGFEAPTDDDAVAGYSKAALEAAADALIADLTDAMDAAIRDKLDGRDGTTYPTSDKPSKDIVSNVTAQYLTGAAFKAAMEATKNDKLVYGDDLEKTQAPLTKKAVEDKIAAIDLSKYNSTDKDYKYTDPTGSAVIGTVAKGDKLTAADAVQTLIDDLKDAIKEAAKKDKKVDQRHGYETAYAAFDAQLDKIKTLEDEDFDGIKDDTTLATSLDNFAAYGYELADDLLDAYTALGANKDTTDNWRRLCEGALNAFWDENTSGSKDGKLFGVAIKNFEKVTRAEASAVYNAMKNEVANAKTAAKAWAEAQSPKATNVNDLYKKNGANDASTFYKTLNNAMDAADKYADVVKEGNKLKARYDAGVKQYNDAKVDEAVKKAEEKVYADLTNAKLDDVNAMTYIYRAVIDIYDLDDDATTKEIMNKLREEGAKYGYDNFAKAIEDAAEKMFDKGTAALNSDDTVNKAAKVTEKVSYGADKTPEADLVYLKATYANDQADDWYDIAEDTLNALVDAQSYDEITAIMKKAAEDFGALKTDADAADVDKAITNYTNALVGFIQQTYDLLDSKDDYSKAYGLRDTTSPLYLKGADLIDDATTVEGVKAAYAAAQALVTGAKSNDELKDMKKAVEKKINDLPALDKLTVADRDAVKEAYAAYAEYIDLAGAEDINNKATLETKYNKVNTLLRDALDDEAEALADKLGDVDNWSDENLPKYIALKEEAKALIAKGDALQDDISDVNEDDYLTNDLTAMVQGKDYKDIEKALELKINKEGQFYNSEIENALRLLVIAAKPGATAEQMKVALDAFNALTERQQLALDQDNEYYYEWAKTIADKQNTTVKELKITAKSTAKKGSITVKWTVKGSADIDGYEVWKSTKHSKGYKKAFTTKKQTYKNTKGLKKGTRYYYKVRAYKMVEGKKITSDWSNKARRVAK